MTQCKNIQISCSQLLCLDDISGIYILWYAKLIDNGYLIQVTLSYLYAPFQFGIYTNTLQFISHAVSMIANDQTKTEREKKPLYSHSIDML